ncbi:MAG: TonB-dependent siderophore receptor [Acidobacteriota bacterium]
MRRVLSSVVVLVLLELVPAAVLRAQTGQAAVSLEGRVVDASRAPIVGARVTAVPEAAVAGSPRTSTRTDQRGGFVLMIQPGAYTLTVAADGFVEQSQRLDATQSDGPAREIVLKIAGVRESVTVSAPAGGYQVPTINSATKTPTPLIDVPQSVTVVTQELIANQMMMSVGDVMRYVPGVGVHQGENNRDQIIMRGNSSSADFFINGVRDDVQYYRDLYNLSRVEVLKGPNALAFGRGGAGGVVNRVGKEALFRPAREASLQGGMYDNRRLTTDLNQPLGNAVALRVNGMFEDSNSFRNRVGLKRYGVTPTLTFTPSDRTKIVASYEYLHDSRVADRGITSFQGRPLNVDPGTYYGNPADSHVNATVNVGSVTIEHHRGALTVRNRTSIANYDRGYQNYVPGAVTADQSQVALTAYNNTTTRTNLFNQTDFIYARKTGAVRHTLLAGVEAGRQVTDNFRNTGFFNNTATSILVPFGAPTIATPVTFRQSATDANNHLLTNLAAAYVQDQVALSPHLEIVGGLRFDRFDLQYHDNRSGLDLMRPDNLVSPRAGVVVKPIANVSVYGSYSVSYLPSSGDQFSSLTTITQQVQPERFNNYETGVKWDARPGLSLTTALYRLDRTNTRSTDPNDPTRIIQTGSTRTNGYELGTNGQITPLWSIAGGYAYQNAFISSATTAAVAGAQVGQVPHHTFSLWNRYQFRPRVSAGLGVLYRSDMFVAVDNTVTLPGYVRADGAVYFTLSKQVRLQANVENMFDRRYSINADSNTNISPGFPRTLRVGLTTSF